MSSHSLRIQTGRYGQNRIPRNERLCLCCGSCDIEDEYHFICICSKFETSRRKYLKKYYYTRPSVYKFTELMKSSNKTVLRNLSLYVKEAFKTRLSLHMNV